MASTGEFTPEDGQDFELEQQPEYPSAFGITFTPTITGAALAVVGAAIAGYLFFTLVSPKQEQKQSLSSQRDDLQSQIEAQPDLRIEQARIERELQVARARQQQVFSLLASRRTLDTLPTDLERAANAIAISLATPENSFRLKSFSPQASEPAVVEDGTFGPRVDGLVERQTFDIAIEGTFVQVREFVARVERLQPLSIVRNLTIAPLSESVAIGYSIETGRFSPLATTQLEATFELDAILPADPASQTPETPEGESES